mmetsp:Transcript_19996/g.45393  ORF Transcript_19996/g.45393 Transcript_19996/m.45393 type:complete len:100 (+) Transcript_19996:221-520(+)
MMYHLSFGSNLPIQEALSSPQVKFMTVPFLFFGTGETLIGSIGCTFVKYQTIFAIDRECPRPAGGGIGQFVRVGERHILARCQHAHVLQDCRNTTLSQN